MRNKTPSSMQKTYDECYLVCSTAVYFEGQNNEAEALRSWRSALDQIYYHNAYKVPPNYRPKNETEKALQDALRSMELQCKERVDLLEALRKSRTETTHGDKSSSSGHEQPPPVPRKRSQMNYQEPQPAWIGEGTVPPVTYPDLSRPASSSLPALPPRPPPGEKRSSENPVERIHSNSSTTPGGSLPYPPATLPVPPNQTPRTSSPDKKGRMLTTLRGTKDGKRTSKSPKGFSGRQNRPPAASKAAGLAWDTNTRTSGQTLGQNLASNGSTATLDSMHRNSLSGHTSSRPDSLLTVEGDDIPIGLQNVRSRSPTQEARKSNEYSTSFNKRPVNGLTKRPSQTPPEVAYPSPPTPSGESNPGFLQPTKTRERSPVRPIPQADYPSYRTEFPPTTLSSRSLAQLSALQAKRPGDVSNTSTLPTRQRSPQRRTRPPAPSNVVRRPLAGESSPRVSRQKPNSGDRRGSSDSTDDLTSSSRDREDRKLTPRKGQNARLLADATATPATKPKSKKDADQESEDDDEAQDAWAQRVKYTQKHLPKGVDENAAKAIFNDIVVRGDEVHWEDVAGLDIAKTALKEAVVYPFLRPDLFMGLREPARGMLLFGPPGTGKTMLARAVATESKSTFFAISASSLTSKWLGESEKLVRALFCLAKALAPSIIFVDEIDSLLSSRGGSSEHETTRRVKTEFLIQWSDLQRAAAGKVQTEKEKQEGDATRVLVLAATNTPWAIDEAARRRFVRRQYIPLPEKHVRESQLRTLLSHQKHSLNNKDIEVLVQLTDGFSGSDITALAKDAAMGPLRSLGEKLLTMSMDDIRPIQFQDFEASLVTIRPSVSKQGLKEFEDWAREFGERGG